ncbi:putative alpha/beta superfamily hydrolase [Winogradskyella pacifica]|uniref:Putative alpha/beta superfamily hydrolase n=1 Tax=Winogradskyella pacifica TaxID=664642 RepID=A0A3D9NAX9_9FLAO|nr:alpha/beta hydrolase-fold protein [Winogradskyella pacifica]REE27639.1 putative alpha/beta superfamily hydrolase [Winogradskyella pacifica]
MRRLLIILVCLFVFVSCKDDTKTTEITTPEVVADSPNVNFQYLKNATLFKGEIHRVDSFPSKYIQSRAVDVWIPESYVENKKYAVLYMHDGQNLFDSITTWNKQEWKIDEWASKLMSEGTVKDFIVVGIHNIPKIRWQDLFPEKAIDYMDVKVKDSLMALAKKNNFNTDLSGDNYLKFIVEELKPAIDKTYSVATDRENTLVAGSSMGGLMSMYAVSEYPDIFGGAACLSTHWVGAMPMVNNPYPDAIFKYMEENLPQAGSHKFYFDYGNKTLDAHYPQYASRVDDILKAKGYTELDAKNLFFEGTDHSENSWNKRLDEPLTFLLGK